jgi:hypothetical protein
MIPDRLSKPAIQGLFPKGIEEQQYSTQATESEGFQKHIHIAA